jgi:transcriptional regulator with PAS, ATPase and Fis domain
MAHGWVEEVDVAITVCDKNGTVLEMNEKSARTFEKDGGRALIGKSLLGCHPEPGKSKLERLLREGKTNAYTIEKGGVKKLIYQVPWNEEGVYQGFVELAMEIPFEMPHFVRK